MQGEIKIALAKNGAKTANVGAFRLHSAFNPQREAERFLEPLLGTMRHGCTVVLIGAGLGYLDSILSEQRPDLNIVACHLVSELHDNHVNPRSSVHRWHPRSRQSLSDFFPLFIREMDVPGLRTVEWPASVHAAPAAARQVSEALAALIRFHTGNISTTAAFGRLWLRNCIRNYLAIEKITKPPQGNGLTLIAASGPSLENHLEALKLHRSKFTLWALPSSLLALKHTGIRPDMLFTSDPGFWARFHGRYFPSDIPVAMPLTASPLPPQTGPAVLLNQKSLGEEALSGNAAIPVPQAGTVAITAIETWRYIGTGPLVLAGLDLAWRDLESHCRPHAFDGWIASFDGRTRPALTTRWQRARQSVPEKRGELRTGPSMKTYADWFYSAHFSLPVYRLISDNEEHYPLPNIQDVHPSIFEKFSNLLPGQCKVMPVPISYRKRRERVSQLLNQWKEMAANPEINSNSELFYNLDPGGVLDIARLGKSVPHEVRLNHYRRVRDAVAELSWLI